jgi:hypothetical protein
VGLVAQQARVKGMLGSAGAIRQNVARARPAGVIAQQAAAPPSSLMTVGDIHIHAAPGMDPSAIAREVRRELARVQNARRGDLHDGVGH